VRGCERADLAEDCLVAPERELGLEPGLERAEADVLEPLRLGGCKGVVLEPVERPPAPQLEGAVEPGDRVLVAALGERPLARLDHALEPVHVDRLRVGAQEVAATAARDLRAALAGGERLAQPRHVHLEVAPRRRALARPHRIHERRPRDDPVRVQDEQREHRGALARKGDDPPLVEHLRRAEQSVLHLAVRTRIHDSTTVMRAR
jgi:hypothetical protein